MSKKAAVAIDSYKLAIFEEELTRDGFEYTVGPGFTPDTLLLTVETETISQLQPTILRANSRAQRSRLN